MPQVTDISDYLRGADIPAAQKQAAWDAFYGSNTWNDLYSNLDKLSIPKQHKSALWRQWKSVAQATGQAENQPKSAADLSIQTEKQTEPPTPLKSPEELAAAGVPGTEKTGLPGAAQPPKPPGLTEPSTPNHLITGYGGALLGETKKGITMENVMGPVVTGDLSQVLPPPKDNTEAIGQAVARTAVGFISVEGLATLLGASGVGIGLKAVANSPRLALALKGVKGGEEIIKTIDAVAKTAVPATFGGMGAAGATEEVKQAIRTEGPERTGHIAGAIVNAIVASLGTLGAVRAARPYEPWRVGGGAPASRQVEAPKPSEPPSPVPTVAEGNTAAIVPVSRGATPVATTLEPTPPPPDINAIRAQMSENGAIRRAEQLKRVMEKPLVPDLPPLPEEPPAPPVAQAPAPPPPPQVLSKTSEPVLTTDNKSDTIKGMAPQVSTGSGASVPSKQAGPASLQPQSIQTPSNAAASGETPTLIAGDRYRVTSADPIYNIQEGTDVTYKGEIGGFHRFDVGGREEMLTDAELGSVGMERVGGEPPAPTVTPRKFSSTQVNIPGEIRGDILDLGNTVEVSDLAGDGRETEPHITVKFGLHDNNPDAVRKALASEGPIRVKLGKISTFPPSESSDGAEVLKIDIDSPDLYRLNEKIAKSVKATDTHPDYKPHLTLAYVKPGTAKKYVGSHSLEGREITLNSLTFSGKDRNVVEIPLVGSEPPAPMSSSIAEKPSAKEPWQMTRNEYAVYAGHDPMGLPVEPLPISEARKWPITREVGLAREKHVRTAFKQGKSVPPEVLADYPDLKPVSVSVESAPRGEQAKPTVAKSSTVRGPRVQIHSAEYERGKVERIGNGELRPGVKRLYFDAGDDSGVVEFGNGAKARISLDDGGSTDMAVPNPNKAARAISDAVRIIKAQRGEPKFIKMGKVEDTDMTGKSTVQILEAMRYHHRPPRKGAPQRLYINKPIMALMTAAMREIWPNSDIRGFKGASMEPWQMREMARVIRRSGPKDLPHSTASRTLTTGLADWLERMAQDGAGVVVDIDGKTFAEVRLIRKHEMTHSEFGHEKAVEKAFNDIVDVPRRGSILNLDGTDYGRIWDTVRDTLLDRGYEGQAIPEEFVASWVGKNFDEIRVSEQQANDLMGEVYYNLVKEIGEEKAHGIIKRATRSRQRDSLGLRDIPGRSRGQGTKGKAGQPSEGGSPSPRREPSALRAEHAGKERRSRLRSDRGVQGSDARSGQGIQDRGIGDRGSGVSTEPPRPPKIGTPAMGYSSQPPSPFL